jgi:aldehyde dehydrogenase (NAD+)
VNAPAPAAPVTQGSPSASTLSAAERVEGLRRSFASGRTRPLAWRRAQLKALRRMITDNERDITAALANDLGSPKLEAYASAVAYLISAVDEAIKLLPRWMRPEKVKTTLLAQPGKSHVHKEPFGVVLIIAPWNYPFTLAIDPLVGALAAGNCCVLKPSEVSAATAELIGRLVPRYLDPACVQVVQGGVQETTELLAERFDYIFYTGNGTVGRIVMAAAARHLTPLTLELGGKSPCLVDKSAKLDVTARRIAWGKFFNAGQTCVAPDYVLVHRDVHESFLAAMKSTIQDFYGGHPESSPDFARVINTRHTRRLAGLLGSGTPVVGGTVDEAARFIAPTVLRDVAPDSPIMQDEIFGPILPVLAVDDMDRAIDFVNGRHKPLALYVFAENGQVSDAVLARTSSGGAVVNHTWIHMSVPELPFGGVGESGLGAYHGHHSFDTFTHRKAVLQKPSSMDPSFVYPPYTELKKRLLKVLL